MSGVSPEDVEAAMATVDPNGPDRRHALSAIVRWQTEGKVFGDREDLVRLYLALKQCRSSEEQCGKITLGLLCSWQRTIKMSVTVTRGFFFGGSLTKSRTQPASGSDPLAHRAQLCVGVAEPRGPRGCLAR